MIKNSKPIVKRLIAKTYMQTFQMAHTTAFLVVHNAGIKDIHISFVGDSTSDYFTLEKGVQTPVMGVYGESTMLQFISTNGDQGLELLMWS
jgi:hypothetical protein